MLLFIAQFLTYPPAFPSPLPPPFPRLTINLLDPKKWQGGPYITLHPLAFFVHHPLDLIFLSPSSPPPPHDQRSVREPPAPHGPCPAGILVIFLGVWVLLFFSPSQGCARTAASLGWRDRNFPFVAGRREEKKEEEKKNKGLGGENPVRLEETEPHLLK